MPSISITTANIPVCKPSPRAASGRKVFGFAPAESNVWQRPKGPLARESGPSWPHPITMQATTLERRKIGALEVSLAGLGCNNFGWRIDAAHSARVVNAAIDAGINFF